MTKAIPAIDTSSSASPRSVTRRKRETRASPTKALSRDAVRARRKFLRHFPGGFRDETYLDWERNYKWDAHDRWDASLNRSAMVSLIKARKFNEIAATAIRIEARTNLLFSFEKMALRDAVRLRAATWGKKLSLKQLFAAAICDVKSFTLDLLETNTSVSKVSDVCTPV